MRLAAVNEGAAGWVRPRVHVANLVEDGEDLVAWSGPEGSRRVRSLRQPRHEVRELALFRSERRVERAIPLLSPDPDRRVEPCQPLAELLERRPLGHRASRSASFSTSRRATSVFLRSGSCSTPSALTNATWSSSDPHPDC